MPIQSARALSDGPRVASKPPLACQSSFDSAICVHTEKRCALEVQSEVVLCIHTQRLPHDASPHDHYNSPRADGRKEVGQTSIYNELDAALSML